MTNGLYHGLRQAIQLCGDPELQQSQGILAWGGVGRGVARCLGVIRTCSSRDPAWAMLCNWKMRVKRPHFRGHAGAIGEEDGWLRPTL